MSRGLLLILDKIREEPGNKILVGRFLTLTAEISDENERADLMLKLAACLVDTDPNQALEVSYGVYTRLREKTGAPQVVLASFDVMIQSLKKLGRFGKAEVLQNEKTKYQTQITQAPQNPNPPPAEIPVPMTHLNKLPDPERKLPKLKDRFSRKQKPQFGAMPTETNAAPEVPTGTAKRPPAPTLSPEETFLSLFNDWMVGGRVNNFLNNDYPDRDYVDALSKSGLGNIGYHEGLAIFWQKLTPVMQDDFLSTIVLPGMVNKTWSDYVNLLVAQEKYRLALYEIRNFAHRHARADICREAMNLLRTVWPHLGIQGFMWEEREGPEAFVARLMRREPLSLENTLL